MGFGRFGSREIVDVVFRPLTSIDIGNQHFDKMQPCLYIESAQTASLEGAATTVYATGGKGNNRLIAWEGEKTLTLNITDSLLSNISFAMLSGAGVVEGSETEGKYIYTNTSYDVPAKKAADGSFYAEVTLEERDNDNIFVSKSAPVYAVALDNAGGVKSYLSAVKLDEIFYGDEYDNATAVSKPGKIEAGTGSVFFKLASADSNYVGEEVEPKIEEDDVIRIDCYTVHSDGATEINIDAESFGGYYYIEASTLFRDEATGEDFPAQFVIPRGKIQSNFTFTLASTGDPSTFDFVIDCFPAYTSFNRSKKVLAQLNIIDPTVESHNYQNKAVHGHAGRTKDAEVNEFWAEKD